MKINENLTAEDLTLDLFSNPPRTGTHCMDISIFLPKYRVYEFFQAGYRITVVEGEHCNGHHILHLHGGAFVFEATEANRLLAERFADWGFRVSVVDYPLAPERTVDYTSEWMVRLYQRLLVDYPNDIFHFLGDSAGGGLAVTVLSLLRDRQVIRRPISNALSSPWIDVSMEHAYMVASSEDDRKSLIRAGLSYAGLLEVKSPLVSPVYGDLSNMGEIMMTYDEDEIFALDCAEFAALGNASKGTNVTVQTTKGLYHDYVMALGVSEAELALESFRTFFLKGFSVSSGGI